jgi:LuxR family maltose regulon positive regulatory protein
MRLQQGDLTSALHWAEQLRLSPGGLPDYLGIERHVAYARVLLAQGRLPDTQRWLASLDTFTRERGLYRWLLTIHILQALSTAREGHHPSARDYLSQALQIAAVEGFLRTFLDEDEQVLALLPDVRKAAPVFVDQVKAFAGELQIGPEPVDQPPVAQVLVEPLSACELEVLDLILPGSLIERSLRSSLSPTAQSSVTSKTSMARWVFAAGRRRSLGPENSICCELTPLRIPFVVRD